MSYLVLIIYIKPAQVVDNLEFNDLYREDGTF